MPRLAKVNAGGGLRRAANPQKKHISLFKIFGLLAIVVHHREIQRIDALEIFRVEQCAVRRAAMWRQLPDRTGKARSRLEHGKAGAPHFLAGLLQHAREFSVDQRVKHNPRRR